MSTLRLALAGSTDREAIYRLRPDRYFAHAKTDSATNRVYSEKAAPEHVRPLEVSIKRSN